MITDPLLRRCLPSRPCSNRWKRIDIAYTLYDRVRVEPNDESFLDAIAFAKQCDYGAIVAVGGGSTIDTAKAVNLYTTYPPEDFLDYVNPPIGKGLPVPGPLEAVDRDSHHGGHRQRNHRRLDFRFEQDARQDRHRQPPAEAHPRIARSRKHAHYACASGRCDRS